MVLPSWKNDPVDCKQTYSRNNLRDFTGKIKRVNKICTSVSRSEEDSEEAEGEEGGGTISFAGSNITA